MTRKEFRIQRALGTLIWKVDVPVSIIIHMNKKPQSCVVSYIEDVGGSMHIKLHPKDAIDNEWCTVEYPKECKDYDLIMDQIEGQLDD